MKTLLSVLESLRGPGLYPSMGDFLTSHQLDFDFGERTGVTWWE